MERRSFAGFEICVESPRGSERQWFDRASGEKGSTLMQYDYGYFVDHDGSDGDELDVYLGPDEDAPEVFVVHQLAAPEFTRHDEDKVFLGFESGAAAERAYLSHRSDGRRAWGGMTSMPVERLRAKLNRRTGSGKIRHENHLSADPRSVHTAAQMARTAEKAYQAQTVSFDAGGTGKVRTGVWDRICVPGRNVKDGDETVFNAATCGQMVRNFAHRGDPVMIDWNHQSSYSSQNGQPAPALGFYGALAAVFEGKVVACASAHGVPAVEPPAGTEDGLWGYRSEITPMGHEMLAGFRLLSPTFTPDGVNQLGESIGYQLLAVAATNTPWQAGTRINFERAQTMAGDDQANKDAFARNVEYTRGQAKGPLTPQERAACDRAWEQGKSVTEAAAMFSVTMAITDSADFWEEISSCQALSTQMDSGAARASDPTERKTTMNPETLAKLGLPADATPEQQHAALASYMEAAEADKASLAKMSAPAPDAAPAAAMEAGEEDKDKDAKKEAEMATMSATLEATRKQLAVLEADRADRLAAEKALKQARFEALADEAVAGGYPKEKRSALVKFASVDEAGARDMVAHLVTKGPAGASREVLMSRMTAGGSPLGGTVGDLAPSARTMSGGHDRRIVQMHALGGGARAEVVGERLSAAVRSMADSKDPVIAARIDDALPPLVKGTKFESFERYRAAEKIVAAERPDLVAATREPERF